MNSDHFLDQGLIKKRIKELADRDSRYCEFKERKINDFKSGILKEKVIYETERIKLYKHLKNARKVLNEKNSHLLKLEGFEQIKQRILALENEVWSGSYLQSFFDSREGQEIKKQYRIAPTNGFFLSMGIIGSLEQGYDYYEDKVAMSKNKIVDLRAREKFYSTRFRTLQSGRFLSFKMNRREIKQFCSSFLSMGNDDFNDWQNILFRLLTESPQLFNKPPYDFKYCYQIKNNGIFSCEGKAVYEWEKIS